MAKNKQSVNLVQIIGLVVTILKIVLEFLKKHDGEFVPGDKVSFTISANLPENFPSAVISSESERV